MIFTLEKSFDGNTCIVIPEQFRYDKNNNIDSVYDLIAFVFPETHMYIGCFNGYENCIVFASN